MSQPSLFDALEHDEEPIGTPPDQAARDFAVDPHNDVVLEASAGTGKTRVLVDRYVRLLTLGVDPRNILAMTFTRKAATEMRDRVLAALRRGAAAGQLPADRWQAISARMQDVQITTIDAFCFGLLREFPIEAGVEPTFEVADETEIARFASEALDTALARARAMAASHEDVRLLFVRVAPPTLREALGSLIDRRQVALPALRSFVARHPEPTSAAAAAARYLDFLQRELSPALRRTLIETGPHGVADYRWVAEDLRALDRAAGAEADPIAVQQVRRRLEAYFLTQSGTPRQRLVRPYATALDAATKRKHEEALKAAAEPVLAAGEALDRDLDALLARGVLKVFEVAVAAYERLLAEHALLDFAAMLDRAVLLLARQEEFARSRLKLQSRYHHLLIDEFQDTSRRQWQLIELLIDAWAEGEGVADAHTSIFVVGDRKQSIYRFRHAEVTLLDEAARRIGMLRPGRQVRQAISTSFRSVPELLAFVNAVSGAMAGDASVEDRWYYRDEDRFPTPPIADGALRDGQPVVGIVAEASIEASAAAVADEVVRLLQTAAVRDRETGVRPARPDDIAILFRARAGHQYFEEALERRGVRTYVYKGLGFFDAPEVQDLQSLLRFLARPESDLRAAELLRSRFVRLSDVALARLAPSFSAALLGRAAPDVELDEVDAGLLTAAREGVARWLTLARQIPPGELLDIVLRESAYFRELSGRRLEQARENIKKVRALVRRVENRGYATLDRLAAYFETLRAGDDSNAIVQAAGAVNLMTIHAAKGLEFPIVFVVNLQAGARGRAGGFTLIEQGPDGEAALTFGTNEATALEDRRETEELRRLLYVALTRARDRLYLAAEVDAKGTLRTRGSRTLAALLPTSLARCFEEAAAGEADEVSWVTEAGRFVCRVCRPSDPPRQLVSTAISGTGSAEIGPVEPLRDAGLRALPASAVWAGEVVDGVAPGETRAAAPWSDERDVQRLAGTLVHRMLQRELDAGLDEQALLAAAEVLFTTFERADTADPGEVVSQAVRIYRALWKDEQVAALLAGGTRYHEVPFSYFPPDRPDTCLRGAIDCIVERDDGSVVVLELKTGRRRPEHEVQLALYVDAVRAMLPGRTVSGRLWYPPEQLRSCEW